MNKKQTQDYLNDPRTGYTCAACRGEFTSDEINSFEPESELDSQKKDKRQCELCQQCTEDFFLDTGGDYDSESLPDEQFNRLATWARWNRFMEPITDIDQVRDFFGELSKDMAWHPDTEFQEYQDREGKRTFDDKLAAVLNQRMGESFDVCGAINADKVYAMAMEASNPEIFAKGEALELLVKAYNAINELEGRQPEIHIAWIDYPAMLEWKVMTKKLLEREGRL